MNTKLLNLYRECFPEDSDEYSFFYIAKKAKEENVYSFTENGEPVSMLIALDNTLSIGGKTIDCPFFAAVCTKPIHRKRGLARKLILKTMEELKEQGVVAVSLYPENAKFYEPLGFTTYAYTNGYSIKDASFDATVDLSVNDAEKMLEIYNAFAKKYYVHEKRTVESMHDRVEEFLLEGRAVGCKNGDEVKAYALYFDPNDIEEVICLDEFYIDKLGISNYRKPTEFGRGESMIRVLDVKKFLESIGYVDGFEINLKVKVTDEVMPQNNCVIKWTVKNGTATVDPLPEDAEYDIDYLLPDLVSTVMRSGINLALLKY